MSGLNYCFGALSDHLRVLCGAYKKGGIDAIGLFDSDSGITNYSTAALWTTAINADNAYIIKGIKGEWPDGSIVEGENPVGGGTENILDGIDHQINIFDFNVNATNDAMWAAANGQRFYAAIRVTGEEEILVIELPVNVIAPTANVPMSNKEKQRYPIQLRFSAPSDWYPIRVPQPTGIFD